MFKSVIFKRSTFKTTSEYMSAKEISRNIYTHTRIHMCVCICVYVCVFIYFPHSRTFFSLLLEREEGRGTSM